MTFYWSKAKTNPGKEQNKVGTVYRRKESKILWIKYYRNGKSYYESTGTDELTEAERLLKIREGDIAKGKLPAVIFDKVKLLELLDGLILDYKLNLRKSVIRAEQSRQHLIDYFGENAKCSSISTDNLRAYIQHRMEEKAERATINRELSALKRAFSLATQSTPPKVAHKPYIPMLKENNTRKGFFEHKDFINLLTALPSHVQPVVAFAYRTGWRKGEIINLTWKRVDLKEGLVRLEAGETKNDDGRTLYLDPELKKILNAQLKTRHLGCPYVFHRDGAKICGFRKAWLNACKKAKLGGMLFHDLRRTGVRNLVRAGVPERVAMMISGHKTRSVFERYNIVSPEDLKQAAIKQDAYLRAMEG
jgi:integrase